MVDQTETEIQAYTQPGWQRYAVNYGSTLILIVSSFLCYHMCSVNLGKEAFELYAVCRRVVMYGVAVVYNGWGIALTYFVAKARAESQEKGFGYLKATAAQTSLFLAFLLAAAVLAPGAVSLLFFGSAAYAGIILPLTLDFVALAFQSLVCQYFVGRMQIAHASVLTAIGTAIIPVLCLAFLRESLAHFFYLKAGLSLFVTVLFFARYIGYQSGGVELASADGRELFRYAASRVPGAFLVVAILSLPVTVATYYQPNLSKAAALSIAVALVSLVATGVSPISAVYLPQAAFLKARGQAERMGPWVLRVCLLIAACVIAYVMLMNRFLEPFMTLLLGRELTGFEGIIRAALPAALPYAYFRCFQGLLDGVHRKPLTTYNALASALVFLVACGLAWYGEVGEPSVVGLLCGTSVLGLLTVLQTLHLTKATPEDKGS